MAQERVVKIRLSAAVAEYQQGMLQAAQATRQVGTEGEKLAQQREAFNKLGGAALGMGALFSAGVGLAVAKFADFDEAMSAVQASTHESAENMELLRTAAIDAGASSVYSATEAANAIEELAKAGVSTADILSGGLNAALDLAAAGELAVADAAGIAATALKTFNLQGQDMSHVADLLAAGAGKAMGDVSDLSQALAQGGQVAAATGLSIEETTAALSAFAAQGLLGSDAGTSLKTALLNLNPTSAEAARLMEELNLSAYDQQGNFIGLAEYAGKLESALGDMSAEQQNATLKTLFGNDAYRAASVLLSEGESGIRDWVAAVDDQGYAAETAAARLDNLKGDLEALGGAFDSALIETGAAGNDVLRSMVQTLTLLVDGYNDLPEPVKAMTLAVGGATAAVTLAGGAALLAVPKFIELQSAFRGANISMKGVSISAAGAGLALGGLFAIVGELARIQAEGRARAEAYADTLEDGTNRITSATRELVAQNLAAEHTWLGISRGSGFEAAEKLGVSLETVTKAAEGNVSALKEMADVIKAGQGDMDAAERVADSLGLTIGDISAASSLLAEQVLGQNRSIEDAIELNEQLAEVTEEAAESTETAADAYLSARDEADALNDQLLELVETINEANGVGQDAVTANIRYQETLAEVDAAVREGARGLDLSTDAGRENMQMLVDLAADSQSAAEAQLELDGNTDAYQQRLKNGRDTIIQRAEDYGATAEEARRIADEIYAIPDDHDTQITVHADRAIRAAEAVRAALSGIQDVYTARVTINTAGTGTITGQADGGPVIGPGGPRDDKVLRRLSNGEHVITAAEVQAAGGHSAVEQWRSALLQSGPARRTPDGPEATISIGSMSDLKGLLNATLLRELEVAQ